jgi:hypothetical protein
MHTVLDTVSYHVFTVNIISVVRAGFDISTVKNGKLRLVLMVWIKSILLWNIDGACRRSDSKVTV